MDEQFLIQMRDCFTAGYTLPQFCIDNDIKKPLFVAEEKFWQFVWEIYVQFHYDKRMQAQFCFVDADKGKLKFDAHSGIIAPLKIQNVSAVNFDDFDKIIFLTKEKPDKTENKYLSCEELQKFFIRHTYVDIPLLNFLQRHSGVKLILTNFPFIGRYKGSIKFRSRLKGPEQMRKILRADKSGKVKTPLDKFGYTNAEVLELMEAPKVKTNPDGSTVMEDSDHPLMQIKDNKRITAYQPDTFKNKIYFVGSCHDFGINAPFDKTIASYLQKMLNEHNLPYRVENESQRYFHRYQDLFYNLNKLEPAPGDIIFVWISGLRSKYFPFLNVADAFDPPNDYRKIFCLKGHVNELGYKLVAEKYFKFLTANNCFRDTDFKYPPPPANLSTATASRRNTNRAARNPSSAKSWRLTSNSFGRIKPQSARS